MGQCADEKVTAALQLQQVRILISLSGRKSPIRWPGHQSGIFKLKCDT